MTNADYATSDCELFMKTVNDKKGRHPAMPPENFEKLSYPDRECLSFSWIDAFPIHCDIRTENKRLAVFVRSTRGHANTSFPHIASHHCLMAGSSHLTRVQQKTQSHRVTLGCSFPKGKRTERWSVAGKKGLKTPSIHPQIS